MPYKVISLGEKSIPQFQTAAIQPEIPQETPIEQLKRVGTSTGIGALKNLESLFGLPVNLLSYITGKPTSEAGYMGGQPEAITDILKQQHGLTPEYLEPRGTQESFIQKFGSLAPFAALGGLPALGRTAAGSAIATGAKQLGLPEPVQDIAQLGTELGLGLRAGRIPTATGRQKIEHELALKAIPKEAQIAAPHIQEAVKGVETALGTETSEKVSSKINHALRIIKDNIMRDKIKPAAAMELRKNLYELGSELPRSKAATYIQPLTKGINDFFATYAAENPTFYKHLKARDKLTELKNMGSYLAEFVDKFELAKLPGGKIVASVAKTILSPTEKIFRGLYSNPEARKLYFDAVTAAATQNPPLVAKNLMNLQEELPKELPKIKSKYKILKL